GAKADVSAPWIADRMTPLAEAARRGDAAMVHLLLDRGAKVNGPLPLAFALASRCDECVAFVAAVTPPPLVSLVMALGGPPNGPALATRPLLARGADPH